MLSPFIMQTFLEECRQTLASLDQPTERCSMELNSHLAAVSQAASAYNLRHDTSCNELSAAEEVVKETGFDIVEKEQEVQALMQQLAEKRQVVAVLRQRQSEQQRVVTGVTWDMVEEEQEEQKRRQAAADTTVAIGGRVQAMFGQRHELMSQIKQTLQHLDQVRKQQEMHGQVLPVGHLLGPADVLQEAAAAAPADGGDQAGSAGEGPHLEGELPSSSRCCI